MRSTALNLPKYKSDKNEYKILSEYLKYYDSVVGPIYNKELKILEIGIFKGGSLELWRDYFPNAQVTGLDRELRVDIENMDRIRVFEGEQQDTHMLEYIKDQVAPDGFDIIIDDASHIAEYARTSFWYLFDHCLKKGGWYIIEDWGTGYWKDWQDGFHFRKHFLLNQVNRFKHKVSIVIHTGYIRKILSLLKILRLIQRTLKPKYPSHTYGMVGFVKQLIDEQGAADLTQKKMLSAPERRSKFDRTIIVPSIVFIKKSDLNPTPTL